MLDSIQVFISYAAQDEGLRRELEEHLKVLLRRLPIRTWHVGHAELGKGWRTAVDSHVSTAQLILLLVSPSFLASDDCHDHEMAKALERWQRGEALVVAILLRPCQWDMTHLRKLTRLPANDKPVTSTAWPSHDEAWDSIVHSLRQLIDGLVQRASSARPGAALLTVPPALTMHDTPLPVPRASAPSHPAAHSPRTSAPSHPDPRSSPWSRPSTTSYPHPYSSRAAAPSHPAAAPAPGSPSEPAGSRPSSSAWLPPPADPPAQGAATWPSVGVAAPRRQAKTGALLPWILVFASAIAGAAVGGVYLARELATHEDHAGTSTSPISPSSALVPVEPPPATPRGQATNACGPSCCGGSHCAVTEQNTRRASTEPLCFDGEGSCRRCSSGRDCIPGPCDTVLAPDRPLLLRLANVRLDGAPPPKEAEVCVRRHATQDPWTCTPFAQAADLPTAPLGGMSTRLPVTTADLSRNRGLDISVVLPGGVPIAWFVGTGHDTDINVKALCRGLRFPPSRSSEPNPAKAVVEFYLDDP